MARKLGVVMDPLERIHSEKDSTLVLMLEAQRRGDELYYLLPEKVFACDGEVFAEMQQVQVYDDTQHWFDYVSLTTQPLVALDIILMRKDPPVDSQYIYTTQLLSLAEKSGVKIVNSPQALRDFNEKIAVEWFPQCCVPTLVSSNAEQLREFLQQHQDIILKPLHGMGGQGIFRVQAQGPNINVIIELLTQHGTQYIMAQQYIPAIKNGDKRILLFHGKPFPYALNRLPAAAETRANLAAGGSSAGAELTERDHWICEQVGATLKEKGLLLVGLDVIGDYLTEINITSPTCLRQIDNLFGVNSAAAFFDGL